MCVCVVLSPLGLVAEAKIREGDCEVCLNVVKHFKEVVKEQKLKKLPEIEDSIKAQCKTYKQGTKEKRLCYYIGANSDSASGFLRDLAKPLSYNMPVDKICEKIRSKDASVCELAYEKKIDLNDTDISKLRVKALKKILSSWGEQCVGCTSKKEFINLIKEKRPLHDPSYVKEEL